jgi:D-3-phosphoglycerate dehydrogenase
MITSQHPINSKIIDAASNLRIIAKRGAKPENVDLQAATEKGIIVTWTPGVNSIAVAEYSIMLMLCLSKQTIPQMNKLKDGAWRSPSPGIRELDGQTIGIVGLGAIGEEVARLARGFRMLILAYDPYVDQDLAEVVGAKLVGLDELLRESDYVTLHAMLTEETRRLINEKRLKLMKKESYLINTARGELVDESALIKALESGIIAGAGLDVFKNEPPQQGNPLLTLPNVVVTPHMAGWSEEALFRELREAAIEIKLVLEGKNPRYPLNPEVFYND